MEEVVQYCTKSKKYRKGRWTKGTIPDTSMEQKAKGCLFYLELFLEIEVPYAAVLPRVAPYKVNHLLAQSKSLDTSIAGERRAATFGRRWVHDDFRASADSGPSSKCALARNVLHLRV